MAKCLASDTAMKVATDAVQVFGGYGYTREYPGRALHARRQDHADLRGHEPDPACGHRRSSSWAKRHDQHRSERGSPDERPAPTASHRRTFLKAAGPRGAAGSASRAVLLRAQAPTLKVGVVAPDHGPARRARARHAAWARRWPPTRSTRRGASSRIGRR